MRKELNSIQNDIRKAAARIKELDSELLIEQQRIGKLLAEMKIKIDEREWKQFVSHDCKMEPNEAIQMIGNSSPQLATTRIAG